MTTTEEKIESIDFEARKQRRKEYVEDIERRLAQPSWAEFVKEYPERHRGIFALMLENQKLHYQSLNFAEPNNNQKLMDLLKEVLRGWIVPDLVSVCPMRLANDRVHSLRHLDRGKEELSIEEYVLTPSTKRIFTSPFENFQEKNRLYEFAKEIRNKITREVLNDLLNNVGTIMSRDCAALNYEEIYIDLVQLAGVISAKTLRFPQKRWLVVGKEIAKKFHGVMCVGEEFPEQSLLTYFGELCSCWNVYYDPLFPVGVALMGPRQESDDMLDAYFYCPYFLSLSPTILDPENFNPHCYVLHKRSKRLGKTGGKFYGKLSYKIN
jgi:hypothetical protein